MSIHNLNNGDFNLIPRKTLRVQRDLIDKVVEDAVEIQKPATPEPAAQSEQTTEKIVAYEQIDFLAQNRILLKPNNKEPELPNIKDNSTQKTETKTTGETENSTILPDKGNEPQGSVQPLNAENKLPENPAKGVQLNANGVLFDELTHQGETANNCWLLALSRDNDFVDYMKNNMSKDDENQTYTVNLWGREFTYTYEQIANATGLSSGDDDVKAFEMAMRDSMAQIGLPLDAGGQVFMFAMALLGGITKDEEQFNELFLSYNSNVEGRVGYDADADAVIEAIKSGEFMDYLSIAENLPLGTKVTALDSNGNEVVLPAEHAFNIEGADDEYIYINDSIYNNGETLKIKIEDFKKYCSYEGIYKEGLFGIKPEDIKHTTLKELQEQENKGNGDSVQNGGGQIIGDYRDNKETFDRNNFGNNTVHRPYDEVTQDDIDRWNNGDGVVVTNNPDNKNLWVDENGNIHKGTREEWDDYAKELGFSSAEEYFDWYAKELGYDNYTAYLESQTDGFEVNENGNDITKEAEEKDAKAKADAEKTTSRLNGIANDIANGNYGTGGNFDQGKAINNWIASGGEAYGFTGDDARSAFEALKNGAGLDDITSGQYGGNKTTGYSNSWGNTNSSWTWDGESHAGNSYYNYGMNDNVFRSSNEHFNSWFFGNNDFYGPGMGNQSPFAGGGGGGGAAGDDEFLDRSHIKENQRVVREKFRREETLE